MTLYEEILEALENGEREEVESLCLRGIEEGISAKEILDKGLCAAMDVVGEKFKNNEIFIPEVLIAAMAMTGGTEVLKPYLQQEKIKAKGKVCFGTVKGDLHDIGKNLCILMLEGKGLEVIDLGIDVSPEKFVQTAIDENCDVIACSALITTTMPEMAKVVEEANKAGIRDRVKIVVGGAPVTDSYCAKIGADAYTPDGASLAEKVAELLGF